MNMYEYISNIREHIGNGFYYSLQLQSHYIGINMRLLRNHTKDCPRNTSKDSFDHKMILEVLQGCSSASRKAGFYGKGQDLKK